MGRFAPYRTCAQCGSGYFVPPEVSDTYYTPYMSPQGWQLAAFANKSQQWQSLLRSAGAGPAGRILDIGSGWGHFVDWSVQAGYDAFGVETDDWAREKSLQPERIFAEIGAAPTDFDVVTMFDVLEHVIEPLPFAALAMARLKPGGRLVVGGPCFDVIARKWWLYRRDPARFDRCVGPSKHVTQFTERGQRHLLEQAGAGAIERVHPPPTGSPRRAVRFASRLPYVRDSMFLVATKA
jgi:SAM-dependent methyltransferase